MIATVLACLVVYAAGSFAAPAAGWEGVRFAYAGTAPPLARSLLIAAVESLVGFGTAALGVALATVTPASDDATLIAASAVGLGFGIARSLRSARAATLAQDAAAKAGDPDKASEVADTLRRLIGNAVHVRALSAAAVPLAAAAYA
ncbi:MAG: hypothetical protein AAFQ43_14055, partial [Bacteroidota bacterium]